MRTSLPFCDNFTTHYNTSTNHEECNYEIEATPFIKSPVETAFKAIYGQVIASNSTSNSDPNCISYYDLTIQTTDMQIVHFIISLNTYFVDCGIIDIGSELVGFYDTSEPMLAIYPPRYQIKVLAFNLPGRNIKADFYDCFLVSQDNQLQLSISNNTYVIDEQGIPYCGNISNKYMVVLYSNSTRSIPAITNPNVVIVLN